VRTVSEAKVILTAEDRTKRAFDSVERNLKGLKQSATAVNQALRAGVLGVSVFSLGRTAVEMAKLANEATRAAGNIDDARAAMGAWSRDMSSQQIRQLAEVGKKIDEVSNAWRRMAATLTSTAAPAINGILDSFRKLMGGATEVERLDEQIGFLERMKGTGFVSFGYGEIGTGIFTPGETRSKLDELRRKREIAAAREQARATVGDLGEVTVSAPRGGGKRAEAPSWTSMYSLGYGQGKGRTPESMAGVGEEMARGIESGFGTLDLSQEIRAGITAPLEAALPEMSVYADQAARNMQDAFANFLFDPFENGVKGMLRSFADAIRQMIAQAAAAKIFEATGITGFIGGLFGGFRASGGPVSAGRSYIVGERGPELFTPGASGAITPNGAGGGVVIAPNYSFHGTGISYEQANLLMRRNNEELVRLLTDSRRTRA
jgi:hypothetical protein